MRVLAFTFLAGLGLALAACSGGKQESPVGTEPAPASSSAPSSGFFESPRINDDWKKTDVNDEQRANDTEDCYFSARALTAHDRRIESDIDAGRSDSAQILQTREFTSRLNRYEERNREIRLFNECMQAKGYAPTVEGEQDPDAQ
ncbi:MAG: hypothetical protein WDZ84_10835 [Rhodovibrionaceae bacterium]